jgi:hypothetical protein
MTDTAEKRIGDWLKQIGSSGTVVKTEIKNGCLEVVLGGLTSEQYEQISEKWDPISNILSGLDCADLPVEFRYAESSTYPKTSYSPPIQ